MLINADKPHLWKADVERSVDFYNDWFLRFAPETYRSQRLETAKLVENALGHTDYFRNVSVTVLEKKPEILSILRMACAPPIARDRLMGLAHVGKNLMQSMEGNNGAEPRIPPRMKKDELRDQLGRICEIIFELADRDLCPWIESNESPDDDARKRAATVVADRLCGAMSDPIIRNAQEQRQLASLRTWLELRGYQYVESKDVPDLIRMKPGVFSFRLNVEVGKNRTNIPVDAVIQPFGNSGMPLLIEAKSAGDATNTNKRRKEEAQKYSQLREQFGEVKFILFLCGYFEPGYLGYEASEGLDWVWEHRISDLNILIPKVSSSDHETEEIQDASSVYLSVPERLETLRFELQTQEDGGRDNLSRNVLGQFSTPYFLAEEMTRYSVKLLDSEKITFLEPAVGSGVFISALKRYAQERVIEGVGVEIDSGYAAIAHRLWESPFSILNRDFLEFSCNADFVDRFNLLCTNPPYVRHHHIDGRIKKQLQLRVKELLGINVSGLSGLYVYFILLAHTVLKQGAVASWLIPSEFLAVNYGKALRDYLLSHVTLLRVHRYAPQDVQFSDALVSSCIVIYKKKKPTEPYEFTYSCGGSLDKPEAAKTILSNAEFLFGKWNFSETAAVDDEGIRLGDLFCVKRGIATGANKFFILDQDTVERYQIPMQFLRPILPGPRYLKETVINGDDNGFPIVDRASFLLDCDLPLDAVKEKHQGLWSYLQRGMDQGIADSYICSHRKLWYQQEYREPPLFLITYMGRSNNTEISPFRFILNKSNAIATNVFLFLYPSAFLRKKLSENAARLEELKDYFNLLNPAHMVENGRTYGGGLHKLEPKELLELPLPDLPEWLSPPKCKQQALGL